ncbi:MAG: energy-coupling factor ABC transporter permease [Bacillota bacterium]
MSHLHLPDGLLPWQVLVAGWALLLVMLHIAGRRTSGPAARRKLPEFAALAAAMLLAMAVPLGPLPIHLNLGALAGILLGPWFGAMAVFTANLFMALVGHGGITVLGLNTIITGSEPVVAYWCYRLLGTRLSRPVAAGIGTLTALSLSSYAAVGVLAAAGHAEHWLDRVPAQVFGLTAPLGMAAGALPLILLVACVEAALTAGLVAYLARLRPGLLADR